MNVNAPSNYVTWQVVDGIVYAPPQQGGVENVIRGSFDYEDETAKTMFFLPKGAIVTETQVDIDEAFNAGSSNTFDMGLGSTADAIVDGAAAGSIARLYPVQDIPSNTPLTAQTNITATYIPSGTAANAGSARVTVRYIVMVTS